MFANLTPTEFETTSGWVTVALIVVLSGVVFMTAAAIGTGVRYLKKRFENSSVLDALLVGGVLLVVVGGLLYAIVSDGELPEAQRVELVETNYDTEVVNVLDSTENSALTYIDNQGRLCNTFVGSTVSVVCDGEEIPALRNGN